MTLDEAIKTYESNAEYERTHENLQGCLDFKQLAAWLKELKQLKEQTSWIPVSERLPNKPNLYTVTDSKGDVVRFVFNDTESSREYWLRCAKAWMPLPEPFEPQERSDVECGK